jgi:hypothetical protein
VALTESIFCLIVEISEHGDEVSFQENVLFSAKDVDIATNSRAYLRALLR